MTLEPILKTLVVPGTNGQVRTGLSQVLALTDFGGLHWHHSDDHFLVEIPSHPKNFERSVKIQVLSSQDDTTQLLVAVAPCPGTYEENPWGQTKILNQIVRLLGDLLVNHQV